MFRTTVPYLSGTVCFVYLTHLDTVHKCTHFVSIVRMHNDKISDKTCFLIGLGLNSKMELAN
jgi:hypothetical protein